MKVLSALGKGLLKGTVKIDIDGDGREDGTLSPSAPDFDLVTMTNPTGRIIFFDDLERCRMPLDVVLGYINSLVEHSGFKVIVIANEDVLSKQPNERYLEIKEKLFGQTLEVRSSVEDALDEFLDEIANEEVADYLSKNRSIIIDTYNASASNNLRVLKHALWDLERFGKDFPQNVWKNEEAARWIVSITLALAIEYRLGRITRDEIIDLFENKMVRLVQRASRRTGDTPAEQSRIELLEERYRSLSFDQGNYDGRVIAVGLHQGWFDSEATNRGFANSIFFAKRSDQPSWKTVWSMAEIDDVEFDAALKTMEQQFSSRAFTRPGEILHVAGLRLFLAGEEVLSIGRRDVVDQVKQYVDDLRAAGKLEAGYIDEYLSHFGGWDGLGIVDKDTPDYRELYEYIQSSMLSALEESLPKKAKGLTNDLSTNPDHFIAKIVSYGSANEFWRLPVLRYIEVKKFVDILLKLPAAQQRHVMSGLKDRYDCNMLVRDLASERPWLERLREELIGQAKASKGISRWRLAKLVEWNLDPHLKVHARDDQVEPAQTSTTTDD
jgi:hypothetical protein